MDQVKGWVLTNFIFESLYLNMDKTLISLNILENLCEKMYSFNCQNRLGRFSLPLTLSNPTLNKAGLKKLNLKID